MRRGFSFLYLSFSFFFFFFLSEERQQVKYSAGSPSSEFQFSGASCICMKTNISCRGPIPLYQNTLEKKARVVGGAKAEGWDRVTTCAKPQHCLYKRWATQKNGRGRGRRCSKCSQVFVPSSRIRWVFLPWGRMAERVECSLSLRESPLLQKLEGKSQPPKSEAEVTGSGCQTKHQVVCTKLYNFSLVNMAQKSARMLLPRATKQNKQNGMGFLFLRQSQLPCLTPSGVFWEMWALPLK